MRNNEIQALTKGKNEREGFYILRNEIVRNSCNEIRDKVSYYQRCIAAYPNSKMLFDPSVRNSILMDLENSGFRLNRVGTQYLATLITMYFHERKLFRRKDIEDNGYFDLSLKNNEHFSMLGTTPDKARKAMENSIRNAEYWNGASIAEVVYTLADNYMYMYREDGDEKNIPSSKVLLKK